MNPEHGMALWLMFIVGFLGVVGFLEPCSKRTRIAGGVWIAFWCFPPLALLWIKGVFG